MAIEIAEQNYTNALYCNIFLLMNALLYYTGPYVGKAKVALATGASSEEEPKITKDKNTRN